MQGMNTLAECLNAHQVLSMSDIGLPEFNKNHQISQQNVLVFDHDDCEYYIILDTAFLSKVGIKLNDDQGIMEYYNVALPLCPHKGIKQKDFNAVKDMYQIQLEDELVSEDSLLCFVMYIFW